MRTFRTEEERERADALCRRLDTYIPGGITFAMWPLPVLEAIVDRLERFEQRLTEMERL
jgi:hypothetical protein